MRFLPVVFLSFFSWACAAAPASSGDALREEVLTAEEQAALTPYRVLELLREGNHRFVTNDLTLRDHSAMVRKSTDAQYPKAIVLSCVDSRVPVEDVFDRGIGDVFVARVAGNFVNDDILGSMEFACAVAGSKLILVMGHEHCGAVKAAIDGVELGNITGMLANIAPAVNASRSAVISPAPPRSTSASKSSTSRTRRALARCKLASAMKASTSSSTTRASTPSKVLRSRRSPSTR